MIELPILSCKHRPEPFCNGVYEIDSKRGEIGNQKFPITFPRIWRELFTSVACLDIRNFLMITPQLKKRLHARDILKLKATRSGDADDWRNLKNLRNTVNSEIKRAKECHYTRNTWRIVNELMSRNSHNSVINEIKLPCGNSIYDSHELSNAFNDHFSSIGPTLRVPYTSFKNSFTHKYLAFSRITKKSKNSFMFTEKSKQSRFT